MASPSPLVSICIPNYNNSDYLTQAIESSLQQTIGDLEVIVCDNQSTDNSLEVARSFSDPRVHVYLNEANLGIYGNFARTVEHSQGKFLKFLCADDWLEPTYLEVTLPYFDNYPRIGLVTTRQAIVTNSGHIVGYRDGPSNNQRIYSTDELLTASLTRNNPIGNPTRVIIRRDAFEQVGGFDITNEFSGDLDLWLRIAVDYDIAAITDTLCYERKHAAQNTITHIHRATDVKYICQAFKKNMDQLPDYWTIQRRAKFCRRALSPLIRSGLIALSHGNRQHWAQTVQHVSQLCPQRYWLPYHLLVSPFAILKQRLFRLGKRVLGGLRYKKQLTLPRQHTRQV